MVSFQFPTYASWTEAFASAVFMPGKRDRRTGQKTSLETFTCILWVGFLIFSYLYLGQFCLAKTVFLPFRYGLTSSEFCDLGLIVFHCFNEMFSLFLKNILDLLSNSLETKLAKENSGERHYRHTFTLPV